MTSKPRKYTKPIKDEPGVTEVRRWRAKLWKKGGGTLQGVMDLLRKSQTAREATRQTPPPKKKSSSTSTAKKNRKAA